MKRISVIFLLLSIVFYNLFASVNPNILINGYLGENVPPSIVLKVNSTIIEDNGSSLPIMDNYNFSNNRSSYLQPIDVFIGHSGSQSSNNAFFTLTVSTDGFRKKDIVGNLIGSPLPVDIIMFTQSVSTGTSTILVDSSSLFDYNKNIFLDLVSQPAEFTYSINPGASIEDSNYIIWFEWSAMSNVPAGIYGSFINFAITSS